MSEVSDHGVLDARGVERGDGYVETLLDAFDGHDVRGEAHGAR